MAFGDFTVARTSVKHVRNASGVLASVAADTPAFEFNADGSYRGTLVEPAATNLVLRSRDLGNASWTKTNATATLTATGANGVANEASIVTATAGNATVLQGITSASSARVFGAYVRRRTGTGTIEITQDNGSTWTAITLTTSFQRFGTASQTLTNPTVGFRIVTSGDEIDVDFCQAETGAILTSPIPTVASTETRTADSVRLTGASSLIGQTEGTLFIEVETSVALSMFPIVLSDGGATNRITLRRTVSNTYELTIITGGAAQVSDTSAGAYSGIHRIAVRYTTDNVQMHINGAQVTSDTSATIPACSQVDIGQNQTGAGKLNGWIRSVVLFPTYLTTAQANDLTT